MKQKLVKVPFDVEMAKKITNGNIEGKIVTRNGYNVRIVCFDAKTNYYPIVAMIADENGEETVITRTIDGKIVPSATDTDQGNLILEIPEYMTFKDGDVVLMEDLPRFDERKFLILGIFRHFNENAFPTLGFYVKYTFEVDGDKTQLQFDIRKLNSPNIRLATETEKQKLVDALKESKEPKAKEYLKRFFGIEEKPKCEFKPFDKVLVRESKDFPWKIDLFSHVQDGAKPYVCLYHYWKYCIPYNEQTAHLLGTTEDYKE